jgi:hypothetical protein
VRCLDEALSSFNVQRQAYYSGSFIGNHVHRSLQPGNINTLCTAPLLLAQSKCPDLIPEAERIKQIYWKAFSLLGESHRMYNGSLMVEDDFTTLGNTLPSLMSSWDITESPFLILR